MNLLHEKLRARGAHRAEFGLFGGGGGSSTSSSTTSNTTTNAADRRVVADGGAIVANEGATINTSDLGAVQRAADLGQAAILGATKTATEANAVANTVAVKSLDLAGNAMVELKDAYANANAQAQEVASGNKTLLIAGAVAVGLVAFNSMGKGKK